jgi:hypothetical protein
MRRESSHEDFADCGAPASKPFLSPAPDEAESAIMGVSRKFVDSFGFSWQVWEIAPEVPPAASADHAPGWLYFFSRGTTRRLHAYPSDWFGRNWADLEDLCGSAEVLGAERVTRLVRRSEDRERLRVALPAAAR